MALAAVGNAQHTLARAGEAPPTTPIIVPAAAQGRRLLRPAPPRARGVTGLRRYLRTLIGRNEFAATRWGIRIESLDRNQVLFENGSYQLFTPASNMKLYTTATALVRLGPEYRARTSLYALAGPNEAGIVQGDLVLYGRGAVDLRSAASPDGVPGSFDQLADQLRREGVRQVRGNILADESYFAGPRLGIGWEWDDLQWPSAAEVSALSVDDNLVEISVTPNEGLDQPAVVSAKSDSGLLHITNRVTTSRADVAASVGLHRGLEDNEFEIWGTVPWRGDTVKLRAAAHDPALFAGDMLAAALRRQRIDVTGRLLRLSAADRKDHPLDLSQWKELAHLEAPPLSEVIRGVNKPSQNLHAEILLRTLGAVLRHEGSDRMGLDVAIEFLKEIDAPIQSIALRDGSGLSRQNLISPALTVALLRFMDHHAQRQIFFDSLPVAGVDGTLRNRMIASRAQQNVHAKTGTLIFTSALSGYLTSGRGEHLVFSIMVNNQTAPLSIAINAIDEICMLLANWSR